MFKSNICPLLSFFTYPIGDCGFKGFNNVISSAKIAFLFDSAKGLAEKNGSGKAARLQGCKLHDVFFRRRDEWSRGGGYSKMVI